MRVKEIELFNQLYNQTYNNTLKFLVIHCNNMDDVNDLIQDVYVEVYKKIKKIKDGDIENVNKYIVGIAKNILKKYYRNKYKNDNTIVQFENAMENIEIGMDLDLKLITNENIKYVWNYVKKKNNKISKIFYLYYYANMKIKEIAIELGLTESTVKTCIYRTISELKNRIGKDGKNYARK
ncbi:rNA polymerase sigma-70 factor ECF [Clostridium sp. CAG:273]|nr:rNA polymerase sigma-70 factor ECF [Clostridium sp. CAG:273]